MNINSTLLSPSTSLVNLHHHAAMRLPHSVRRSSSARSGAGSISRANEQADQAPAAEQVTAHLLLNVIAGLTQVDALSAREIGDKAGLNGREAQKVLPLLASKGRISRQKRARDGARTVFYYWMSLEQKTRFKRLVKSREQDQDNALHKEICLLQEKNELLIRELHCAQQDNLSIQAAARTLLSVFSDPVKLSERLTAIRKLLERPALSDMATLQQIEKDYSNALHTARNTL